MKWASERQKAAFKAPLNPGRQSDKLPEAGKCTCPAGPWCQGPGSADWLTCLGHRCAGCRMAS